MRWYFRVRWSIVSEQWLLTTVGVHQGAVCAPTFIHDGFSRLVVAVCMEEKLGPVNCYSAGLLLIVIQPNYADKVLHSSVVRNVSQKYSSCGKPPASVEADPSYWRYIIGLHSFHMLFNLLMPFRAL